MDVAFQIVFNDNFQGMFCSRNLGVNCNQSLKCLISHPRLWSIYNFISSYSPELSSPHIGLWLRLAPSASVVMRIMASTVVKKEKLGIICGVLDVRWICISLDLAIRSRNLASINESALGQTAVWA